MLVEINLLPRKKKKEQKPLLWIILVVLLGLILGGLFYWQYMDKKEQLQSLENDILQVNDTIATVEVNLQNANTINSSEQLQQVIDWTETYPIDTVFVLKYLIGLLPERGYFQQFSYNEEGTIQLSIRFDTSREAADYYTELTKSKYISSASLTSITATKMEGQTASGVETNMNIETNPVIADEQYLPRYTGIYEVKLNTEALKEATQDKGQDTEKGEAKK